MGCTNEPRPDIKMLMPCPITRMITIKKIPMMLVPTDNEFVRAYQEGVRQVIDVDPIHDAIGHECGDQNGERDPDHCEFQ